MKLSYKPSLSDSEPVLCLLHCVVLSKVSQRQNCPLPDQLPRCRGGQQVREDKGAAVCKLYALAAASRPFPAAGPAQGQPGARLPLRTMFFAWSHVTGSLHSIFKNCVIVLRRDTLILFRDFPGKQILIARSLTSFPLLLTSLRLLCQQGFLSACPSGSLSFLLTFQVRNWDASLMPWSQLCL